MFRPQCTPADVEMLLGPPIVRWAVESNLKGAKYKEAKERLAYLCKEMAVRITEELDKTRFPNISAFLDEAQTLSHSLGFESPPVEAIHYDRDDVNTYKKCGWSRGDWPSYPLHYGIFLKRSDLHYVWGYRLHDPTGFNHPIELYLIAVADVTDPHKPLQHDPWADEPKTEHRLEAVTMLHQWVRWLDGLSVPDSKPVDAEPATKRKVSSEEADAWQDGIPPLNRTNGEWLRQVQAARLLVGLSDDPQTDTEKAQLKVDALRKARSRGNHDEDMTMGIDKDGHVWRYDPNDKTTFWYLKSPLSEK